MRRTLPTILAIPVLGLVFGAACTDDRVSLVRGPLGPARYAMVAQATGDLAAPTERREATLLVAPRGRGASFTLRTAGDEVIEATLNRVADGSLRLDRVRGATVGTTGQADLAALVGQLDPPLPNRRVRLGDRWSSTQRIVTDTLDGRIATELRIERFRRVAGTDAAELTGTVRGELRTTGADGGLQGKLAGSTRIAWAVVSGRVVEATTQLVWTLEDGTSVSLQTSVTPL